MDVLSNIWNLLTTENEMLTKIITAPTVFIENYLGFLLIVSILQLKYKNKYKFTYVIFVSSVSLFNEFIIPSPYNVIINYALIFLFIKFYLKLNIIKSFIALIIPTASFALIGNLILNPFLTALDVSYIETQNTVIYRLLFLLILYLSIFLLITILKILNLKWKFLDDFNAENKKIILINLLLAIFTLVVQLIITFYYINTYPIIFTFLNFISLFAYFFISFSSLTRTMELQITTENLESVENYNNTLTILYDNVKAFKHDFDNMIFTIGGFINTNDMNGLKKYYSSLEKECQNINNVALLNPTLINNPGIYNLLTAKYKKAKDDNVEIQLEFFFDLNKLHMPIYDFSRMLGIFLDNAIEAAALSKEKIVKIIFRDSSKSHVQIVQIENSYINKNINTKKIFEKGITEKENHLGMGLWEVNQILNRNNNVNLITEHNDLYFKQCLEIYY